MIIIYGQVFQGVSMTINFETLYNDVQYGINKEIPKSFYQQCISFYKKMNVTFDFLLTSDKKVLVSKLYKIKNEFGTSFRKNVLAGPILDYLPLLIILLGPFTTIVFQFISK